MGQPRIEITRYRLENLDPALDVFHVAVSDDSGSWEETFGTEALLRAFLCGVRAGSALQTYFLVTPEIPTEARVRYLTRPPGDVVGG